MFNVCKWLRHINGVQSFLGELGLFREYPLPILSMGNSRYRTTWNHKNAKDCMNVNAVLCDFYTLFEVSESQRTSEILKTI